MMLPTHLLFRTVPGISLTWGSKHIKLTATKVFNTFEGGAIICNDLATKQYIDKLKNFGFVDETTVDLVV